MGKPWGCVWRVVVGACVTVADVHTELIVVLFALACSGRTKNYSRDYISKKTLIIYKTTLFYICSAMVPDVLGASWAKNDVLVYIDTRS